MDDNLIFLLLGMFFGFVLGIIVLISFQRVSGFFLRGQEAMYREKIRSLQKRIRSKDKQIDEMMKHAEKIAIEISKQKQGVEEK